MIVKKVKFIEDIFYNASCGTGYDPPTIVEINDVKYEFLLWCRPIDAIKKVFFDTVEDIENPEEAYEMWVKEIAPHCTPWPVEEILKAGENYKHHSKQKQKTIMIW